MLITVLLPILLPGVVGSVCTFLCRSFTIGKITYGGGRTKTENAPARIPEDAVLSSLNWGQSSSNEYECFAFDVTHSENRLSLSGWYIDPESERRITAEDVLLTDEQCCHIGQCLKEGSHRPPPVRHRNKVIYDETGSSLSVCWKTADGGRISAKYNGRGEDMLLEQLKACLCGSAQDIFSE